LTRVIPVYPGEGERLVAGFFWKQQGWLFKQPTGIYTLDTSALDLDLWRPIRQTNSLGIAGPLAYAIVEGPAATDPFDDVPPGADASWHRLTRVAANQEGDAFVSSISELTMGQFIRDVVDLTHIWFAQMIHFADIHEVQAAVRWRLGAPDQPLNNLRIKCNLRQLSAYGIRFHHSDFPCEALTMARKPDVASPPRRQVRPGALHNLTATTSTACMATSPRSSRRRLPSGDREDLKLSMKTFPVTLEYDGVGQWPLGLRVYRRAPPAKLDFPMARGPSWARPAPTSTTSRASARPSASRGGCAGVSRIAFHGGVNKPGQHFAVVNLTSGIPARRRHSPGMKLGRPGW
jgi:hypothetical protein